MKKEATNQRMQAPLKGGKGKGMDSLPELPEGTQSCQHTETISDF